jgi:hypothetical protein
VGIFGGGKDKKKAKAWAKAKKDLADIREAQKRVNAKKKQQAEQDEVARKRRQREQQRRNRGK